MKLLKKHVLLFVILIMLCSCGGGSKTVKTNANKQGKNITIDVTAGDYWTHSAKLGIMKLKITPQIAVWIEDLEGNFVDTIYVTQAFGKQNWAFIKYDPDKTIRGECMPYWMNQRAKAGLKEPTKNSPLPDSVTGATPKNSFTINSVIPGNLDEFVIYAEVGKSFDSNDHYTEEEYNYKGQPSIVYAARINTAEGKNSYTMELVGHSGDEGADDQLYTDTSKLTTVKSIVEEISILL